jgi:DNA topoisomerase-1
MVGMQEEAKETAKEASLRYVTDSTPGITRKRAGRGWHYTDPDGAPIHDRTVLARITSLVIPPAWTQVWICPSPNGHIQATGLDERGRKQYRYHRRWREVRDENKYGRMLDFGKALPKIRKRVDHDLSLSGLCREKVLATVVSLLETTLIRVGNEEYARTNKSFGLTTLRNRHVKVDGSQLRFKFKGKSGKMHSIGVRDRQLARIVKQCQELQGQELFEYVDDEGERRVIRSSDVNEYLQEISGEDFTAKDFRTWAGTVLAATALQEMETADAETEAEAENARKHNVVQAIKYVAGRLGNTPAICRKCYIHPRIMEAYLDGTLADSLKAGRGIAGLQREEAQVLRLLRNQSASGHK